MKNKRARADIQDDGAHVYIHTNYDVYIYIYIYINFDTHQALCNSRLYAVRRNASSTSQLLVSNQATHQTAITLDTLDQKATTAVHNQATSHTCYTYFGDPDVCLTFGLFGGNASLASIT
jgi:hypothetical protein